MKRLLEVLFMGVAFCVVATAVKADIVFSNLGSAAPAMANAANALVDRAFAKDTDPTLACTNYAGPCPF